MRQNYYNDQSWQREQGPAEEQLPLQPVPLRVQPYGQVPPQGGRTQQQVSRTPQAWEKRTRKKRRSRERKGIRVFALVLALILALTGVGTYLHTDGFTSAISLDRGWRAWWEKFGWPVWGGWDNWEGEEREYDWVDRLGDTRIERGPVGTGVTLRLAERGEESLAPQEIFERVSPAVVGVRIASPSGMSVGTGVIMSSDGYIITNAHVVAGGWQATIVLSDDSQVKGYLVGFDQSTDLAVLKVNGVELTPAEFGDSDLLRVGEPAYAIGNPLGEQLRRTMTDGIISAIDRQVDMSGQTMTLVQTTAALNKGNSGGALINSAGQVIGITNMKMMSELETIEGLGFAVPSTLAKSVVDQIIQRGYISRPMLGITVTTTAATEDSPAGVLIKSVKPESDAYAQGLRAGHIIVWAQGAAIKDTADLEAAKKGLEGGDILRMEVWFGPGDIRMVEVTLREQYELN